MRFERVAIVGVGLIGGSFGLALKAAGRCGRVVGAGRGAANLQDALRAGAIDEIAAGPAEAAEGADLVLVATPVSHFAAAFAAIAPRLKPAAIVTDAGSTKRDVVAAARAAFGARVGQFVPGHPIAGAEKSGAAAASAGLFRGRRVVLAPLAENPAPAVDAVAGAWEACGARVARMTPEEHDGVFAAVSHLPHLLAYALVSDIAARPDAARLFGYAAGGFRDFTRIASSHPEMWRDICVANRDGLLRELGAYEAKLGEMRAMLQRADGAALERLFGAARDARQRWLDGGYE